MFNRIKVIVFLLLLFSCKNEKGKAKDVNDDRNPRVIYLKSIADSLYHRNDFISAIRYFDTLIQLDPGRGEYYYKQGYSYDMVYKRPELEQSIKDYHKSIELGYKVADSYYNLGLSYMFVKDSIAIIYFKKTLELDPKNPDAIYLIQQCKMRLKNKSY